MENKKLTSEELETLRSIHSKRLRLIEGFGDIEIRIQELTLKKEILTKELSDLHSEEIQIGTLLQQKYGDGSINLEKGEFMNS